VTLATQTTRGLSPANPPCGAGLVPRRRGEGSLGRNKQTAMEATASSLTRRGRGDPLPPPPERLHPFQLQTQTGTGQNSQNRGRNSGRTQALSPRRDTDLELTIPPSSLPAGRETAHLRGWDLFKLGRRVLRGEQEQKHSLNFVFLKRIPSVPAWNKAQVLSWADATVVGDRGERRSCLI